MPTPASAPQGQKGHNPKAIPARPGSKKNAVDGGSHSGPTPNPGPYGKTETGTGRSKS